MEKPPNSHPRSDKSYFKTYSYASVIQRSAFQQLPGRGPNLKVKKGNTSLLQEKNFESEQQWKYLKIPLDTESLSYLLMGKEEEETSNLLITIVGINTSSIITWSYRDKAQKKGEKSKNKQ